MCFSAEASFGAAAVLTTVGVVTYQKAGHTPYRLLAAFPLLFGIQQFAEGVVWTTIYASQWAVILSLATYAFIFFAWIVWPLSVPFLMWKLEGQAPRKRLMAYILGVGFLVAGLLTYVMIFHGVNTEVVDCSIAYRTDLQQHDLRLILGGAYLTATVLPLFLSSIRNMWVLGSLILLGYLMAHVYYQGLVISVWCFFAALASGLVLLIVLQLSKHEPKIAALSH